ncbi:sugar phosphate isomerase/epimerase [Desulfovibrio sulfodismutans]|uniref:Sugar phosphate isomerase/epimerase n=1 Tax=Desulfolutivibrio sulfodismutans TaxID=63561 RepID=A0A7K3NIF3_9BACT|nr:sugar phosphate isomerase/epimerase family protein [Desulfolutivibrio sulfodismutans]NDY55972.1 sugar phosphate isomerase/epimerase [Desulfolutivibrio sulfodismutans]QLA13213.1 TIM barrel protein [Desulfolutivibrio sulfodismutans DSM 3696]
MTVSHPFHVSLSLRAVRGDPALLDAFLEQGLHPELGLDPILMDAADPAWHRRIQGALKAARVDVALHLPFFDLQPGAADALIREATKQRLMRAMEVAAGYCPTHLVGHAAYDRILYIRSYADWRDRAVQTWAEVLDSWSDHPPLHLENVHETDPATVAGLALALREHLPESAGRLGVCFDIGHWHSFAGGHALGNLDDWVQALAPVMTHLHLHDNDGTFDQHLAPGTGTIPWPAVFAALSSRGLVPSVTFETHDPSRRQGIAPFLAAYADAFPFFPIITP